MDTFRALQYSYIFKGHLTIDDKRGEGVWSETPKLADMIVNRAKKYSKADGFNAFNVNGASKNVMREVAVLH